ncbi:hypothetical protein EGK14_07730 [Erwinia sp. 198]|nr:hypothetical protein EGK14_07730 [Erwinia sp. 198]
MKKIFKYWWQDFLWEIFCVRLPLMLTLAFAFFVVTYWYEYALLKIVSFLIITSIACDRLFKRKR